MALVPQLDKLWRDALAESGGTGGAVGIAMDGEVVYLRGFGVRDVDSKRLVDEDTRFRIGSVSKTITALAVMRLRDRGKLDLDAPASRYLPVLGSIPLPTRDSPPITTRHLLTMTSGLAYDDLWGAVTFGYDDAELERFLKRGVSFAGAPGERYRYSNLGYALLGKIVERVSGMSFEQYVRREVFGPLGMTASGYVSDGKPTANFAVGYYKDEEKLVAEPVDSDGVFAPAGGAYASIRDLTRYAAFQVAAYPPRDAAETGPVRRSTLREMHAGRAWARWLEDYPVLRYAPDGSPSLTASSYGFGWAQNTTCLAEAMVQHGGFEPGYFASIRLLPRERLGVVVLSATSPLGSLRFFERAMAVLKQGGMLESPAAKLPELEKARDTVLRLLNDWDPKLVEQRFDPLTQRYSFVRNFRRDMERMGKAHGRCRHEGELRPLSRTHGRFRLSCERGTIDFVAYLTPAAEPVIQMVEWAEKLPASEAERKMAHELVGAISRGLPASRKLFPPGDTGDSLQRQLARLHADHTSCTAQQAIDNDGQGNTIASVSCGERKLELSFHLDEKSSRVTKLSLTQPREYGAVCVY